MTLDLDNLTQLITLLRFIADEMMDSFAEALSEAVLSDVKTSLSLLLPDYFGYSVVHYEPINVNTCALPGK